MSLYVWLITDSMVVRITFSLLKQIVTIEIFIISICIRNYCIVFKWSPQHQFTDVLKYLATSLCRFPRILLHLIQSVKTPSIWAF